MRLWTITEPEVYDALRAEGALRCDPWKGESFDEPVSFQRAYDWMVEQMVGRLPGYHGGYPWWGWARYGEGTPRPDLRSFRTMTDRGREMVMLELEIPDGEALLSDFDAWHMVLNNHPILWDGTVRGKWTDRRYRKVIALDEAWWEAYEGARRSGDTGAAERMERERRASWDRIFDEAYQRRTKLYSGWHFVQACYGELRLADVRRVSRYRGTSHWLERADAASAERLSQSRASLAAILGECEPSG